MRHTLLAITSLLTLVALSTSCGSEGSSPCELTVAGAELLLSRYGGDVGAALSHAPGGEVCRLILQRAKPNFTPFTLVP